MFGMFSEKKEKKPFDACAALNQLVLSKTLDARISFVNSIDDDNLPLLFKELGLQFDISVDALKTATGVISQLFNHPVDEGKIPGRCMNLVYKKEVPGFIVPNYKLIAEEYDVNPLHWDDFYKLAYVIVTHINLQIHYPDCKQAIELALLKRAQDAYSSLGICAVM